MREKLKMHMRKTNYYRMPKKRLFGINKIFMSYSFITETESNYISRIYYLYDTYHLVFYLHCNVFLAYINIDKI